MTEPLRFGILGAARISDLSIIEPAHQLGHRLVAVAAHHRQRAEQYAVENDIERVNDSLARCSLVGAIREGSPFPTTSADAVENMIPDRWVLSRQWSRTPPNHDDRARLKSPPTNSHDGKA